MLETFTYSSVNFNLHDIKLTSELHRKIEFFYKYSSVLIDNKFHNVIYGFNFFYFMERKTFTCAVVTVV